MKLNIDPSLILQQTATKNQAKQPNRANSAALRKKCQEFEAIFVRNLLKNMRATIPSDGVLEKNNDREIFEDLMDMEVASQIARKNELGIADLLFRQLYRPEGTDKSENQEMGTQTLLTKK
jgi:flagellar protein FlgJ